MDASSSTKSNRMGFPLIQNFTPNHRMQEIGRRKFPNLTTPPSLRMPGHVYAHRHFVLNWDRQEGWRVNFEVGKCRRNCSGDVNLAAVRFKFEGDLLVLGGLTRELNLEIGINRRRCGGRFWQSGAHGD